MEEVKQPEFETLEIKLKDIKWEKVSLSESKENLKSDKKVKKGGIATIIPTPEDISFDSRKVIAVTEGFTPNALKNLITISEDFIRVYTIQEDSIKFFSKSPVPKKISKNLFKKKILKRSIIFNQFEKSLQLLSETGNRSCIIKFNPESKDSVVESIEEKPFYHSEEIKIPMDLRSKPPKALNLHLIYLLQVT